MKPFNGCDSVYIIIMIIIFLLLVLIHAYNLYHTVPAPTCSAPVSSNGVITVTWSYIHTGGLPLTNLFLTYTYSFIASNFTHNFNDVSISSVNTTSVIVSKLIAGAEYTFNITVENNIGLSNIICGPTSHIIGEINIHPSDKL